MKYVYIGLLVPYDLDYWRSYICEQEAFVDIFFVFSHYIPDESSWRLNMFHVTNNGMVTQYDGIWLGQHWLR